MDTSLFLKSFILLFIAGNAFAQQYYDKIPSIFDDFSYTSTQFPIAGDSSNSLYGKNIWLTDNGTISSRAWHRYNWGDGNVIGAHAGITPSREGVTLFTEKGFRFGTVPPIFLSGFAPKSGVFVSKVRMSAHDPASKSIHAFWLMSPDHYRFKSGKDTITHYTEVDFEWNNWFSGLDKKRMHATTIGALHSKKGLLTKGAEIHFFQKDTAGKLFELGTAVDDAPEFYFENRWYYYVIRVDSIKRTTEYFMESADDGNPRMDKVLAGSTSGANGVQPLIVTEYYPQTPLMVLYNIGTGNRDNNDSLLKGDMKMDVDWFYYSPHSDVSLKDILSNIKSLRLRGISRSNTSGIALTHDISQPHIAMIIGTDTLHQGQSGTWTVEPSLKNTSYDIEFTYRFKNADGFKNSIMTDTRTLSLLPENDVTEIELKAIVKNFWTKETITVLKNVTVIP